MTVCALFVYTLQIATVAASATASAAVTHHFKIRSTRTIDIVFRIQPLNQWSTQIRVFYSLTHRVCVCFDGMLTMAIEKYPYNRIAIAFGTLSVSERHTQSRSHSHGQKSHVKSYNVNN